jgi:hypothetical protein
MGLPKQFNDIIEGQLNIFAAWLPITNTFQLGDYGIIADGVFAKMGNIKEFGIDFTQGEGKEAKIDFTSDSTHVTNFAAGAQVDVIPEGAIDAKVTFKFDKEKSFIVKAPSINVSTIENVNEVGTKLIGISKWEKRFKVVYQTYFAKDAAIMSTIDAGTEISFTGDAKALQQLSVGSASVGFNSSSKLGLDLQGAEGIIGLGLFQIKRGGFLGTGSKQVEILDDEAEPLEIETDAKNIEDDL